MNRRTERGAALIMATVVLFTVSTLVVAVLMAAGQEFKSSSRAIQNLNALMLSEAAGHRMLGQLNTTGAFPPAQFMPFQVLDGGQITTVLIPYPRDQYFGAAILRFGDDPADARLSGTAANPGRYWGTFYPLYGTADLPPQPYDINGPPVALYGVIRGAGTIQGELRGIEMYVQVAFQPPNPSTPFDAGLFVDDGMALSGNFFSDSFNSQNGTYAAHAKFPVGPLGTLVAGTNGNLGSNGSISASGNLFAAGNATPGPTSPPAMLGGNAFVLGSTSPNTEFVTFPPITFTVPPAPAVGGPIGGNYMLSGNNSATFNSGTYAYNRMTFSTNGTVTIPPGANVTFYAPNGVNLQGNTTFNIGAGATVTFITPGGGFGTSGNASLDNQGGLSLYSGADVSFSGNAVQNGAAAGTSLSIYMDNPASTLSFSGNGITNNSTVKVMTRGDVSITGNGIASGGVNPSASLEVFVGGDFHMSGNGAANYGSPHNVSVWSSANSTQDSLNTVHFSGNASFTGTLYAPQAQFHFSGNAEIFGAVVADSAGALSGNANFHYDESLNMKPLPSSDPPQAVFRAVEWKELSETNASILTDGTLNWPQTYWPSSYSPPGGGAPPSPPGP